jgi:hypothetical protein
MVSLEKMLKMLPTANQLLLLAAWSPAFAAPSAASLEAVNLFAGFGAPEFDYESGSTGAGLFGWSYYIRAFDLLRDTPQKQIGWGQWTKPKSPADDSDSALSVCSLHPHGFVCDEAASCPVFTSSCADQVQSEAGKSGCGHIQHRDLVACQFWECGQEGKGGIRGSIEGGMGYWEYTLETPHVKWMLPGSTSANYEVFGGTLLNDRPQPCTSLGGAVRISNRFLIPNDFVGFDGGDAVDGFLGYMLTRTPIGKRSPTDSANYWTIVIDAANYAGPVMYMATHFWDMRTNWHPNSSSWSDPRYLIGYIAEGFEGAIGAQKVSDGGSSWLRTNAWARPQDVGASGRRNASTLFTGHAQYNTDWAAHPVEAVLDGSASQPSAVLAASRSSRTVPTCNNPLESVPAADRQLRIELEGVGLWSSFGVDVSSFNASESAANGCPMTLNLDTSQLDCESTAGFCAPSTTFLRSTGTGAADSTLVQPEAVPSDVRSALEGAPFEPHRRNDGRTLSPGPTEQACFAASAADGQLFCTRTSGETWIAWRWYRFVDQPELNQVFASLPEGERDAAKCFMQTRIERLHAAQQAGSSPARCFDPPQGVEGLPQSLVTIDPALILTPPAGLEVGYVPVPVYQKKREKPPDCDVVVGTPTDEPSPLPTGYYETGSQMNPLGTYEVEVCPANSESLVEFSYPGRIFPYSPHALQRERHGYDVPLRSQLAPSVAFDTQSCASAATTPASPPSSPDPPASPPAPPVPPPPPSSPTPSPTPPAPPPPLSPGYVRIHTTVVTFRAAGTVDDFDVAAQQSIASKAAALSQVEPTQVNVSVTAASVVITIRIEAESAAESERVSGTLLTALGNASAASAALGVSGIESTPDIEQVTTSVLRGAAGTVGDGARSQGQQGPNVGAIVGAAVAGALVLLLIATALYARHRAKKGATGAQGKETPSLTPSAVTLELSAVSSSASS